MSAPLDVTCLPATARLDLLVRGLLRCRPSRRPAPSIWYPPQYPFKGQEEVTPPCIPIT
jgi:hypothetical protein